MHYRAEQNLNKSLDVAGKKQYVGYAIRSKLLRFLFAIMFSFALLLACMTICGCSSLEVSSDSTNSTDSSFSATDLAGRTMNFDKPAQRVVALAASDVEILYALGAGDKIVARGTYCDYPAEASAIKDVGSGELMSVEAIIALKPDAVFMSKMGQTTAQVYALENAGLKVLVNDASTIQQTYDYIRVLGKVVAKDEQAESTIKSMQETFSDVSNKMTHYFSGEINQGQSQDFLEKNRQIYFEVSPLQYGLWTAGNNTFMQEIAEILCMQNAFSDISGWSEISQEQVIARNPGTIIAVTMYDGEGQRPEDEICSRACWDKIDAVQKHHVYNIDSNTVTRPGPRLADAANEICNKVIGG